MPVNMTMKLFDTLFDCINENVFSKKLVKWHFYVDDAACNAANALCGYVSDLVSNAEKQRYEVVLERTEIDGMMFE